MDDAAFLPPNLLISDPDYLTRCVGLPPGCRPVTTHRARLVAAALAGMLGLGVACTQSYLYDERAAGPAAGGPRRSPSRGGSAPSGPTTWCGRSRSSSPSTPRSRCAVSDPNGTRAFAVVQLLNSLPRDPNISFSVMLFAGSTTAYLTKTRPARVRAASLATPRRTSPRSRTRSSTSPTPTSEPRLDRLHQGALGDLRPPQHGHHPGPEQRDRGPGGGPAPLHRHLPLRRSPHLQPGRRALPGRRGEAHPPAADPGGRRDASTPSTSSPRCSRCRASAT